MFRHVVQLIALLVAIGYYPLHAVAAQPSDMSSQNQKALETSLLYVSDYFSFVGKDAHGHVAFALDNNRGKDDEAYQAEHFVVLHDEQQGWIDMQGSGSYENLADDLIAIPDSSAFQFLGTPETGMTIISESNALSLTISAISPAYSKTHKGGEMWVGSASSTLQWKNRTLKGRVIYEYLMIPDFNRLSRTYWGLWKEFQGFYLSLDGAGDLYVHSQQSDMLAPLVGTLDGFMSREGKAERFQILQLTPLSFSQGFGLYRWPMGWAIRWVTAKGGGSVQLKLSEFHRVANWVIGGFAMGIVQGNATYRGKTFPVYGLVELIM
ncbi:hypothetical protein [Nitrospira sp. M1]